MTLRVHVIQATVDPSAAPEFVGQHWINTSTNKQFLANGTASVSDWAEVFTSTVLNEQIQDVIGATLTDTASIDFTYNDAGNQITAAVLPAGVDHNSLQNFVANKHIDHSAVTLTAGTGLTGGGDITASRTLAIATTGITAATYGSATQVPQVAVNAQGQLTSAANVAIAIPSTAVTDFTEAVQDVMGGALVDSATIDFVYNDVANTQTANVIPGGINHNALQNYVANQHIDHSAVSITAGTYLSGGGDITASRTLNHANSAVTAGSYGGVNAIPVISVGATGHVESASTVNTTSGLLTGLSATLGGGTVVATDTILQAFNKMVGESNNWIEICTSSTYTNNSAVTGVNITEFSVACVAGRKYYYEAAILYQTAATTTGIGITCTSPDTFSGPGALLVNATTGADGTASLYSGTINSLGDYVTTPSVQTANQPYVLHIKGNFPCSVSGTLNMTFRSEVALSTVTVLPGSTLLVREFP